MLADTNTLSGPCVSGGPDHRPLRSWPLLVLALPASVAVWSGWVGIGQMTGFGIVRPLPGIWDGLRINTAVTLPVGVEAYAAMALHAWLARSHTVSARTRMFARRSAIGSLGLGMTGQIVYHLLAEAHVTRAPWEVTTLVASLPVVVLGLGSALGHMLQADAIASDHGPAFRGRLGPEAGPEAGPAGRESLDRPDTTDQPPCRGPGEASAAARLGEVRPVAEALAAAGHRVSRRSLRAAGIRGSNSELSELARLARVYTG